MIPKWIVVAFIVISLIGFADAAYLTAKHYLGTPLPCVITAGCETVTTSQYATMAGIPVALLGAIYYLAILILSAYALAINSKLIKLAAYLTPIGFLASIYFIALQLFVIKALCIYCLVSAATSTLLFILGIVVIKKLKFSSK